MMNLMIEERSHDYQKIARAIQFIEEHAEDQPSLEETAAQVHLSPFHFQRLFRRWVGVSPKSFLQFLTVEKAKECLRASESVLTASFKSGLSGPGRLYDLMIQWEGLTPGEYKKGPGEHLSYGSGPSLFGDCFIAWSQRGLTRLTFLGSQKDELNGLKNQWPELELKEDNEAAQKTLANIFRAPADLQKSAKSRSPLKLLVRGSQFELKIWRALLALPPGSLVSYGQLGDYLGMPKAGRAIGNAVGKNSLAYLIPCHRVLKKNGAFHNYRWGPERKKLMIAWEAVQGQRQTD
ncbi:MAG: methylated-DNA--[protein]-cysteine S-methyltransferase [Planctomycetota bacterium]|nr:methylated-DNA--[protein]-cysteine S-methyltransferase [Planctomycetota bacterium]